MSKTPKISGAANYFCWLYKEVISQLVLTHLAGVLPLRGLGAVVHEVDLAGGRLGFLPACGERPELATVAAHIVAVLPEVTVLLQHSLKHKQLAMD